MRRPFAMLLALCAWLAWSTVNASQPGRGPARIIERLVARDHPDQAYALFLPTPLDPARPAPALILLDPRGRALDALRMAAPGAAARGWILLSAYGSRSDVPQTATLAALQAMLDELDARYPRDPRRVYLAGMSGTAKTLWAALPWLRDRVAGLIGVCAGRPPELGPLDAAPPAFAGLTGDRDFNYRDLFSLDADLDEVGASHHLQTFAGAHGWPPDSATFAATLDWLELTAMRQGRAPRDESFVAAQWAATQAGIAAAPDALERLRLLHIAVRDFDGWRDTTPLAAEATRLAASPEVRRLARLDATLRAEERHFASRYDAWSAQLRTPYIEGRPTTPPSMAQARFSLGIARLQQATRDTQPRVAASAERRLELAYVGASFYLPNLLRDRGELSRAIAAYELAWSIFPDRPRAPLGLARIHARLGHADAAFAALETAARQAPLPREALQADPDLAGLHADPRWSSLLARATASADPLAP